MQTFSLPPNLLILVCVLLFTPSKIFAHSFPPFLWHISHFFALYLYLFILFAFLSPHIIFLSQSVLDVESSGRSEKGLSLCGSRLCHEIAHSWFGLVIGARDWTEEWISEGFATYLEDIIWAQAQKVWSNCSI